MQRNRWVAVARRDKCVTTVRPRRRGSTPTENSIRTFFSATVHSKITRAMNCTELDEFVSSASENVATNDVVLGASLLALFLVSFALLTYGEELVRPLAAFLGGVAGAGGAFLLTRVASIPCEVRLVTAAVAGTVLSVLTACVLKTGLFLLGAFGLGAMAHLVWASLPTTGVSGPFTLAGRQGWYYIALGAAASTGAIVSQLQKKRFTRIASSVVGGSGLALGTHLIYARRRSTAPTGLLLAIVIASSVVGNLMQQYRKAWREKRRRGGGGAPRGDAARKRSDHETVPMGRPVHSVP